MKKIIAGCLILLSVSVGAIIGATPIDSSIFDELKVGQSVTIRDCGQSYEVSVHIPDMPSGQKIVGVKSTYLVVADVSGVRQLRIPLHAIKSVAVNRNP